MSIQESKHTRILSLWLFVCLCIFFFFFSILFFLSYFIIFYCILLLLFYYIILLLSCFIITFNFSRTYALSLPTSSPPRSGFIVAKYVFKKG